MAIIISKKGKNAVRLEKESFKQEQDLQKYIYDNPDSLPLNQIKEDVYFLVVDREFPISVGSIDVLQIDSEGDIYIIETKLYRNPDKRVVLSQVLDYGASLWGDYEDPDDFIEKLNQRMRSKTGTGFIERVEDNFGESENILNNIKQNLSNGIFNFVILMDKVPSHLRNLVLFINQNSQFSVYTVELEYYKHDEYEIMIPHVYGAESKKKLVSSSVRKKWDEESFFQAAKNITDAVKAIRKIYEFSEENADEITWGTGALTGSFNPKFLSLSGRSIFTIWSDGTMTLNHAWLDDNERTIEWRTKFLVELKGIKPIGDFLKKSTKKFPNVPYKVWTPVVDEFIDLVVRLLRGI